MKTEETEIEWSHSRHIRSEDKIAAVTSASGAGIDRRWDLQLNHPAQVSSHGGGIELGRKQW